MHTRRLVVLFCVISGNNLLLCFVRYEPEEGFKVTLVSITLSFYICFICHLVRMGSVIWRWTPEEYMCGP